MKSAASSVLKRRQLGSCLCAFFAMGAVGFSQPSTPPNTRHAIEGSETVRGYR
jgi:hypothetical protein